MFVLFFPFANTIDERTVPQLLGNPKLLAASNANKMIGNTIQDEVHLPFKRTLISAFMTCYKSVIMKNDPRVFRRAKPCYNSSENVITVFI